MARRVRFQRLRGRPGVQRLSSRGSWTYRRSRRLPSLRRSALRGPGPPASRRRSGPIVEVLLCSLFTILPDYLFRRYVQGKRFGAEINLYTVWYELRWGITTCLMLTILLITLIFYYHPSTKNAFPFFRTAPLLPGGVGRVSEIYVDVRAPVKAGQKIFR